MGGILQLLQQHIQPFLDQPWTSLSVVLVLFLAAYRLVNWHHAGRTEHLKREKGDLEKLVAETKAQLQTIAANAAPLSLPASDPRPGPTMLEDFPKGIESWLGSVHSIETLDMYCLTSHSYYQHMFDDRSLSVDTVRILLPSEEAVDALYRGTARRLVRNAVNSAANVKAEIELASSKWEDLQILGRAKSVSIRYVDILPSFYVSVLNRSSILAGFYVASSEHGAFNGLRLAECRLEHEKADETTLRGNVSQWFNALWAVSSTEFTSNQRSNAGKFFDRLGRNYVPQLRYDEAVVNQFVTAARTAVTKSDPAILDVGCGVAEITHAFSRSMPSSELYLLDQSPEMIDLARQKVAGHTRPATLIIGDAESKAGLFRQYDVIVLTAVLHLFNDPLKYLASASASLSRNGVIAILTYDQTDLQNFLFYRLFPGFKDREDQRITSKQKLIESLSAQGLRIISNRRLAYKVAFSSAQEVEQALSLRQFSALAHLSADAFREGARLFLKLIFEEYGSGPIVFESSVSMIIAAK